MSFIALVLIIAVIGLIVGLVQATPRIPDIFKSIALYVGIAACVLAVLQAFGLLDLLMTIQVPHFGKG